MTDIPDPIPSGPIDREPLDYPKPGVCPSASDRERILRRVFADAGVELGVYDERVATWFAAFADWGTFATVVSWVKRAGESGGPDTAMEAPSVSPSPP